MLGQAHVLCTLVLLLTAKYELKPFDVRYSGEVVLLASCVFLLLVNT